MLTKTPTRVNLGCGEIPLHGYCNVDAYSGAADLQEDFFAIGFRDLDEVRMDHALEHVSWLRVPELLARIHSWLRPGGTFTVEVPDMEAIMRWPPTDWQGYVYGCQAHEGEYHRSGYTALTLERLLQAAGFTDIAIDCFESEHPMRPGMPCLKATCRA